MIDKVVFYFLARLLSYALFAGVLAYTVYRYWYGEIPLDTCAGAWIVGLVIAALSVRKTTRRGKGK